MDTLAPIPPSLALSLAIFLLAVMLALMGFMVTLAVKGTGKEGLGFVGFLSKSTNTFDTDVSDYHRNLMFIYDMGIRQAQCGLYLEASGEFLRVIQVSPKWPEPRYHLGMAYLHLREPEKAQEQADILREMDETLSKLLSDEILRWPP